MYQAENVRIRHNYLVMAALVVLPVAVGILSSVLTSDAMQQFGRLRQPPLSPPAWLFPVAWTILYVLMGVSSYLVYMQPTVTMEERRQKTAALVVYAIQLVLNFSWSIVFFGLGQRWVALGILMTMWALIIACAVLAFGVRRMAGFLLVPYVLWTTFAAYLNLMTALLN